MRAGGGFSFTGAGPAGKEKDTDEGVDKELGSGDYKILSPSEYVSELGLDSDDEDEVQEELDNVRAAWKEVQEDGQAKGRSAERPRVLQALRLAESERRCWRV